MSTTIGLPTLTIRFQAAAQEVLNRSKRGHMGLILRDAQAEGIHVITNTALIPTELGEANKESIRRALRGSDRGTPVKAVVAVIPPDAPDGDALEGALTALESYVLDYLAGPDDITAGEATTVAEWVKAQRKLYRPVKAVLPNQVANDMGVVNFATEDIHVGEKIYSAAAYCGRIAGILAGTPSSSSATYAALPEVTGIPAMSTEEQSTAIKNGKLILFHDGMKAKIARAVNSLTTIPADGKEDWCKIKIVEGMDLVTYFARTTIEDAWLGVYANSYDNKMLLVVAIQTYFNELEAGGVLLAGSSSSDLDVVEQERWLKQQGVDTSKLTQQQIREADTGSWVFLLCAGRFLDAMEDFQLIFNNL